ncbi:MAG: prepilin-type N-terminal cleavage/methylation domain-containing protein [Proteobacteria bacterium]|nr:prepilin-type N-terminal cleavage/methylation domain-containing protein [Pseudomonadota bacterium]
MRPDKKTGPQNRENGFTLVEIMIGIVVLSLGLLAIASMQMTAAKGNAHGKSITTAVTWAQEKVEYLMTLPYNHQDLVDTNGDGDGGLDDIEGAADHMDPSRDDGRYTIYWNVSVNSPISNTKKIRVTVTCPSDPIVVIERVPDPDNPGNFIGRRTNVFLDYIKKGP